MAVADNPVGFVGAVVSPPDAVIVVLSNTAPVSERLPSTSSSVGDTVTFVYW